MVYLFVALFLISGALLILGLIKPDLILRWGTVKKRIKVFYIFAPLMLLFFILVGIFAPVNSNKDKDKGRTEQKNPTLSSAQSILAVVEKDPDYQDWLEIEKQTTPFSEDKKWLASVWEFLLEKNKKWQVVDDESILSRIELYKNKPPGFNLDYDVAKKQLDNIKKDFRSMIIQSIHVKKAIPLLVPFDNFRNLVRPYGFNFHLKENDIVSRYWSSHTFYRNYKIKYGKTIGDGECFMSTIDQSGNMMDVSIPLTKGKIDHLYLVDDPKKRLEIQKEVINEIFSNPPPWLSASLKMFLGADTQSVENKILEIGKADTNRLKEIFPKMNLESIAPEGASMNFIIGDKSILIYYVNGTAAIGIQNSATKKMKDEVFLK